LSILGLAVLFGGLVAGCADGELYSDADLAKNDVGVAEMGRYEYAAAEETFAEVVASAPNWLDARVNHAIATLNRQEEGDEQRALDILAEVLAEEPGHLRAMYTTGILRLYLGEAETATRYFQDVVSSDPRDAYAAYFLGQSHLQLGDYASAAQWLVKATELDPYLRSAYWASAQALRRVGRTDDAQALLEVYQRFAPNPAARLADFAYKRMGPKAEALAVTVDNPVAEPVPEGPVLAEPRVVAERAGAGTLTAADVDGDGGVDIFVSDEAGNAVWHRSGRDLVFAPDHPLANTAGSAALWGDVDDDGVIDVVLCSGTGVAWWRQGAANEWAEQPFGVDASRPCAAGALFDADHDGDLDVFTVGPDGAELYSNNRDGTFRLLAEELGIRGGAAGQVAIADLDSDRDMDIVVLNDEGEHDVWENDRTWQYEPFPGLEPFRSAAVSAVTAADVDADGHVELLSVDAGGDLVVWDVFEGAQRVVANVGADGSVELAVADFNGDGVLEVMATANGKLSVVDPADGRLLHEQPIEGLSASLVATLDAAKGPSVVAIGERGLQLLAPGSGRHPYIAVAPTGRSESDQMRSNASGIGTRMKTRVGGRWTVVDAMDTHSGPGQSLAPYSVGLNGREFADFIALEWSDGVTQSEIGLGVGELHEIAETQRQLASCPVVFVWDGEQYRFVTDVLGVGGLGFFASPGVSAAPRPYEVFLFEQGLLTPKDGRYHIKLTEPMEENAYLDAATLKVFDVPSGWSVVIDERMGTDERVPTGEPIFYRRSIDPVRVLSGARDVTHLVTSRDLEAPDPGPLDARFVGLLDDHQVVTVEFQEAVDPANAVLVADGWVEYGYSQTVFAAWQAGERYESVTLEARGADGVWQTVAEQFGYPAGMPRQMALPLPDLPEGTRALRLSSNMEIYWDRIRLVIAEDAPDVRVSELPPVVARVAKPGFAERTNGPQRVPSYDYSKRSPYWDTKFQQGYYTALGDALELVSTLDSAVAIIGGGEEIHLEFDAPAPVEAGFDRHIAIDFRGWAKDMDLYTEDGETVGPLPVLHEHVGREDKRRIALHERYNVRFQAGF
jgi:tetratricopeptide (TPR) repeat protein